jgi:hypothetical protein
MLLPYCNFFSILLKTVVVYDPHYRIPAFHCCLSCPTSAPTSWTTTNHDDFESRQSPRGSGHICELKPQSNNHARLQVPVSKRAVASRKESRRSNFHIGTKDSDTNSNDVVTAIQDEGENHLHASDLNASTKMVLRFWMRLRWWILPQVPGYAQRMCGCVHRRRGCTEVF